MNLVLFDELNDWKNLLPLTFTRPVSEIRIGILTIREKWELYLNTGAGFQTQDHLSKKFKNTASGDTLFINAAILPDNDLLDAINGLGKNELLVQNGRRLVFKGTAEHFTKGSYGVEKNYNQPLLCIDNVWDIFKKNAEVLSADFKKITGGRKSQPLSKSVTVIGDPALIFLEAGAKAEACILNTTGGPVYLAEDAEIMEGSMVRGPFALGAHSALKLGTKVYGASTVGPHCKVGGELSNSVIFGYSNKAHDGFLGNSVIGEWCNLGADSNNSNLKNNYGNVKLYNYAQNKQIDTGLQFCGLIMGDHSKSGINTMFNTGTVVGVGSNIYGGGFPATYIPNFSWGGSQGFESYRLDKLFETAEKVFERRGLVFDETEKNILSHIYNETAG